MSEIEKIHFIGIGGAGMSAIATVLLEIGHKVSGSDLNSSEITKRLQEMGGKIYIGHDKDYLCEDIDTVVISSAIPENNPEVVKAKVSGIPVIQRAEMLGRLMKRQKGIAVAGAHGKTTTSSMISLAFERNEYDPTVVVGGELNDIGGNAKLGLGEYLVAEADESDGSFLKLSPYITVVTNIEDDHLDYYKTRENIKDAFLQFIESTHEDGFVVVCADDPVLTEMAEKVKHNKKVITYGASEDADYVIKNINLDGLLSKAVVIHHGKVLGELELNVPGKHNLLNALATVVVGMNCGMTFDEMIGSLKTFKGVQRRFQKIGYINEIMIFDDYAHHPTELKATLSAAKNVGAKRIIAVFQPHRFSRTKLLADEFGSAFMDADVLFVNEIYAAGEKPITGVNANLIIQEIEKCTGQSVQYIKEMRDIIPELVKIVKPGDIVLTLGAGNIWEVGTGLRDELYTREKVSV